MKRKTNLLTLSILAPCSLFLSSCEKADSQATEPAKDAAKAAPVLPAGPTPSPEGAEVYIISPKDGATVGQTFTVQFGLKGMGIAPAGIYLEGKSTGHHHLAIDSELPDLKLPFPADDKRIHYGGGQTEAELTLEPGEHTLQLVLGDHTHTPHAPPVISEKITITVE